MTTFPFLKWAFMLLFAAVCAAGGPMEGAGTPAVPHSAWATDATNRFDSAAHRHWLWTNVNLRGFYPGNPIGYIPTNPVVLREYALEFMLGLAKEINGRWDLALPKPLRACLEIRLEQLLGCSRSRRHAEA